MAIAIVAETCGPFTVLPALMNEYRLPELNVQNGVLKALSFLFEYIGEMGKDYVYAVTPLLEDALMDRDLVHRQTSGSSLHFSPSLLPSLSRCPLAPWSSSSVSLSTRPTALLRSVSCAHCQRP